MKSLRVRLQLAMALILALTVSAVGLSFARVSRTELARLSTAKTPDLDAIARALEERLAKEPGAPLPGIVDVLVKAHRTGLLLTRGTEVLAGGPAPFDAARAERAPDGSLSIHAGRGDGAVTLAFRGPGAPVRLADGGASLYPAPAAPPGALDPLRRAILVVVVAAGLAGALLVFAVSRRLTDPLEERTAASERLRREMVSDVAHELRAPLTNLRGELESIQDGVRPLNAARVDALHADVLALSALVDDLQDLALADAGQMSLERAHLDLRTVAQHVVEGSRGAADAAGVSLTLEDGPSVPAEGDARRLAQVLRNFVQNALAHTQRGGRVTVRASRGGRCARAAVEDSGEGIAPDVLPLVFERFYRADKSRARATGGAGLGLAIAKKIAEAHGGRVGATSAPGAGSEFWVEIPAAS
jgi:signal transduction histidine kinase